MSEHYNAFISYKHAPEDNRVAELVERGLQRFRIPKKLQKSTGVKRINRIFRDKSELPLTSDLGDKISGALDNSDFLIVICSTNTKDSAWVPREIEYFLRTHSRRQVFTVLVNGEPADVIPEILQYEDRTVTDVYGNSSQMRIPLEPLSCDFRMPARRAKKEELPRLVSAMIGCPYSELVNRQRQYHTRRLVLIFTSIIAVVLSYAFQMIFLRDKVKNTYIESLRTQSIYLANESEHLLKNQQRITALHLAVAALPKDADDERPVTGEALRALTDAELAYVSIAGLNLYAAWDYIASGIIYEYILSPNGTALAVWDSNNRIMVWETTNHKLIMNLRLSNDPFASFTFLSDKKLLLHYNTGVELFDIESGESIWKYTTDEESASSGCAVGPNDDLFLTTHNGNIFHINAADGSLIETINFGDQVPENHSYYHYALSPDGTKLAMSGTYGVDQIAFGVYDIKTGKLQTDELDGSYVKSVCWYNNDFLLIALSKTMVGGSMELGEDIMLNTDHTDIYCYSATDLSQTWYFDFTCNDVMYGNGFLPLPKKNSVAFYCGNIVDIFDIKTGERLYHHNMNNSVVDISDRDEDGWPMYITENGCMVNPAPSNGTESVQARNYFTDDLSSATVNNGVYTLSNSKREIIYYGLYISDEDWHEMNEDIIVNNIYNQHYLDEKALGILSPEDDGITLTLFDTAKGELARRILITPDTDDIYDYGILGTIGNDIYVEYYDGITWVIYRYDIYGANDKEPISLDNVTNYTGDISICEDKLCFFERKDDYIWLSTFDPETQKTESYKITEAEETYIYSAPIYLPKSDVYLYNWNNSVYLLDINTGKVATCIFPAPWMNLKEYAEGENGEIALTSGEDVYIVDKNGNNLSGFSSNGSTINGLAFCEDKLVVAYSDGTLGLYTKDKCAYLSKSNYTHELDSTEIVKITYDKEAGLLYLQTDLVTDIIETQDWIELACIQYCFGHHAGTDRFYTYSFKTTYEYHIGYFKHYTTEELIQKAKDILQDSELSDEKKTEYGITDN